MANHNYFANLIWQIGALPPRLADHRVTFQKGKALAEVDPELGLQRDSRRPS